MADGVPEVDDKILSDFLSWCGTNGLILSEKVRVGLQGSCHRYGMVATDNIEKEECLFEIPRALLLQPNTSSISEILETLTNEDQLASERGSGWAPLLLALMYEYTNPTSHWKPYLNLVPDVTVLDQPMFWGEEERQRELDGTGIEDDVESDIHRIEEEYNTIVLPFIKKHKKYFSESCHTIDLYKHMAAFVMAYSFTEQKPANDNDDDDSDDDDDGDDTDDAAPAMVPMADILNHISNNNAHLEFGAKTLSMVATQDIFKGQEIFNTYDKLANCHLLQSYGFVEDELPNPYDMVEVPISSFCEVMKACQPPKETRFVDAKFKFLEEMGVASEDDIFLFGREGCSQFGPDLYATLRILHLSEVQFKKLLEEQLQREGSTEFDDIRQVLDQQDEDCRKDSSWRILELIFNSENKNKKKRRVDDEKSEENKKSRKELLASGDCNLEVVSENNSLSKNDSENGSVNGLAESGILKKDMILSTKKAVIRPAVDGNSTESKTENVTNCKSTKNGCAKEGLESCNRERAGNGHVVKNVRGYNDVDEVDDDMDDDDDDGDNDAADDDGCGGGDGDEDDDDDDDEDDDDADDDNNEAEEEQEDEVEGEEVDEEESEQPLTYELLSQWPIEWRKTLKRVAELCIKKRYGQDNMDLDCQGEKQLSKRQLSVLKIKRGQKSIFQRICELVVEN